MSRLYASTGLKWADLPKYRWIMNYSFWDYGLEIWKGKKLVYKDHSRVDFVLRFRPLGVELLPNGKVGRVKHV